MAPPNSSTTHKRKREATDAESGPSKPRGGGRGRGAGRGASSAAGRGRGGGRGRGRGAAAGAGGGKQRKVEVEEEEEEEADAPVGVSKLKAQLRQTRRLLKKDNVAPPVRQEAQRREVALVSEIAARERENTEREHAKASHAARFFDRQKLVRRIAKLVKQGEGVEGGDKEATLKEARIRLNYVLNWPHQHAYVPLYPTHGTPPLSERMAPPAPSKKPSEAEKLAHEVRARIAARMADGALPALPEVELRTRSKEGSASKQKDDLGALAESEESAEEDGEEEKGDVVAEDDFFAREGESDEE